MPLLSNQIFSLLTIYILFIEDENILLRHRYQRRDLKIKNKKKKIKKKITNLKSYLIFNILDQKLLIIFCKSIVCNILRTYLPLKLWKISERSQFWNTVFFRVL